MAHFVVEVVSLVDDERVLEAAVTLLLEDEQLPLVPPAVTVTVETTVFAALVVVALDTELLFTVLDACLMAVLAFLLELVVF